MIPKECYEQYGKDLDGCSTQSNEGCGRCSLNKNEGMNPALYGNSTTTINIDYYNELKRKADFVDKMISPNANEIYKELNELKAKADKWDEKETPFDVIDFKIDVRRRKIGGCKCNATVVEGESYCWNCGQRLNWEE